MDKKRLIAKRIASELSDGMFVNLGVGIPTAVCDFIPDGVNIWLESENGICGLGPTPRDEKDFNPFLLDASKKFASVKPGGSVFDSQTSFGLIRGGHVDCTILGAFQVDSHGNIANWLVPNGKMNGMGGAMDLVCGAKKVIVAMEHLSRDGESKIVEQCTYPLTGLNCVSLIVTDLAVIEVTKDGLLLKEVASDTTVEEVVKVTSAKLLLSDNIKTF